LTVTTLTRTEASGWSFNMHLVPLEGGGVLVQSPTWLGDDTARRVMEVGEPRLLFAPNYFHWLGIQRFREKWPGAEVVAGSAAIGRLRSKTGLPVRAVSELHEEGVRFLECPAKNGETWLVHSGALVVSDAFFNIDRPVSGAMGLMLRVTSTVPGLRVGRTFRWVAVGDWKKYRAWAETTLRAEQPTELLVSHGARATGADLTDRLVSSLTT
jgi:hypothetical protein